MDWCADDRWGRLLFPASEAFITWLGKAATSAKLLRRCDGAADAWTGPLHRSYRPLYRSLPKISNRPYFFFRLIFSATANAAGLDPLVLNLKMSDFLRPEGGTNLEGIFYLTMAAHLVQLARRNLRRLNARRDSLLPSKNKKKLRLGRRQMHVHLSGTYAS